jgi:DNA-binding MarR family transcriptional regulator
MNLQQTNRVIQSRLEQRIRAEADLSWPEFEVLWRLHLAAEHPLLMSEIATQLIGSPSGTTRIADRLEADGLIERETPRQNRRVVQVTLTDRGRARFERADAAFRTALEEAFSGHLSEAEAAGLRRMLRKLLERNGAWLESRCDPNLAARTPGGG